MEIKKLNNILYDLIDEDEYLDITLLMTNVINSISQNQSIQIEENIKQLNTAFIDSKVNSYSISNLKILKEIKGNTYFGIRAKTEVEQILNSTSFNTTLTVQKLQEYQKKRNEFVKRISDLKTIFSSFNIEIHFYDDDTYEVGIIFPDNVTGGTIKTINQNLHKWDLVFKTLKELIGESVEDTKISMVDNGSLEFFFENSPQIALCLSLALERLATLYKRILEIRTARLTLENLGIPKTESSAIQEHEKSEIDKEIKEIVEQIFKNYSTKLDAGRKNELKAALSNNIKFIAKSIDKGIIIEITPPEISEPDEILETDSDDNKKLKTEALKSYQNRIADIETTRERIEGTKKVFSSGKDIFKYLSSGEEKE